MWEFVRVKVKALDSIGDYLQQGYEPFAVSVDSYGSETIWLKRELSLEDLMKKEKDEVPSKPDKPIKGTSRRTAVDSKG